MMRRDYRHVGREVAPAPQQTTIIREVAPQRKIRKIVKWGGRAAVVGLVLVGANDVANNWFGFHIPGFSGSTDGITSSSIDQASYTVEYAPKDCSSEVTALAPTKAQAHYHLPIIHTQTGSVNIDKDIPLQWGMCNPFTGTKTPTYVGRVGQGNGSSGKVVSVVAPVPLPTANNVAVADLNLDICLPETSGASYSQVQADRARYIADAKAGHHDPCELESNVSGFVVNDATSAEAGEFSRQLAIVAGYAQPIPRKPELEIMRNSQRAMIAHEEQAHPGAKISAPLTPIETTYEQTLKGWETVMYNTDAEYLFSNIYFSSEPGQGTVIHLGSGSVSGTVELVNDPLTPLEVQTLNNIVPHFDQPVGAH